MSAINDPLCVCGHRASTHATPDSGDTRCLAVEAREDLARHAAVYPLREPYQLIKRIRLPYGWRERALRTLARMEITEDTMFPGVDGAGRATANQIAARELALRDALNTSA